MAEFYTITVEKSEAVFSPRAEAVPEFAKFAHFSPDHAPADLSLVCRMGSPDILHCLIFRYDNKPGGIFALHEQDELLFVGVAETNLAYAAAKGLFGELTSNARLGVDIFESPEAEDD